MKKKIPNTYYMKQQINYVILMKLSRKSAVNTIIALNFHKEMRKVPNQLEILFTFRIFNQFMK